LYEPSTLETEVAGVKVRIEQVTRYPLEGSVDLSVDPTAPVRFDLFLRIPGWCTRAKVLVNGKEHSGVAPAAGSLVRVHREWNKRDRVSLVLDMPARVVKREYAGNPISSCLTVERGPLILALPQRLNPDLDLDTVTLLADSDGILEVEAAPVEDPARLGSIGFRGTGFSVVQEAGNQVRKTFPILLVPYASAGTGDKYRVEFAPDAQLQSRGGTPGVVPES
jgi:hypothetical protein